MKQKYQSPKTIIVEVLGTCPLNAGSGGEAFSGNSMDTQSYRKNGNAGMAASRGNRSWDDE
ncbi:MAG: hypothetical protein IJ841_10355 [Prevotella sp.]|nr:hypothetical protein [Prevotella sp.]